MMRSCMRPRAAAVSFLFFASAAAGATPHVVLSLSGSGTLPSGEVVTDNELVLVDPAGATRRFLNAQTLALYFGDRNGDGVMDAPGDLDALEIVPVAAGQPMIAGVHFSLLVDQGGIKDGDIVRFDPGGPNGGLEVVHPEGQLVAAVAANDGNIDVDGIAFLPDGSLLFSLAEDELSGPQNVVLADDDVLLLPAGGSLASVQFTGAQLETMVQAVLGVTVAITDVKGLEFDGTDVLFTVQSPTSDDATIFSTANGGSIHAAHSEGSFAFGNEVEADALALFDGDLFPNLRLSAVQANDGDQLTADVSGLTPAQPFLLLLSGNPLPQGGTVAAPGFGTLALDPLDPMFLMSLKNAPALAGVSDGLGRGSFTDTAPPAVGNPYDLAVQVLDAASGRLSNPVLLEVNQ